jgi:hypothetical protein
VPQRQPEPHPQVVRAAPRIPPAGAADYVVGQTAVVLSRRGQKGVYQGWPAFWTGE